MLATGLQFSLSLLTILTAHEAGHYLFCRYYGVDATLPFFIPQPPGLLPGTFGAFIRMKSVVPSRRALFDIGLAGPLAGFVVMLPVAFIGVLTLEHHTPLPGESGVTFNDPLLFQLIGFVFKINLADGLVNPFYLAAWFGALVTALNLMPVGQLDGGHGTFSVFGQRAHWWIGRIAFVSMAIVSVLGWFWHGSPSGFVYVVLLAVLLRVRHPQPQQMEPLGFARKHRRGGHIDRFCAVLFAVSDYDYLNPQRHQETRMKRISVVVVIVLFGVLASYEAKAQGQSRSDSGDSPAVRGHQSQRRQV